MNKRLKDIVTLEFLNKDGYIIKLIEERKIEELVSAYFRFIRDKADVLSRKKTCLKIPKDKRKQYFKSMQAEDILEENRALHSLYQSAFEVFFYVKELSQIS